MTTGGDNKINGCSYKNSSTGCLCRGAVQLFACRKVGCGKMGSHMCIDDRYYRQLIERCHYKEDILNIFGLF
jgi:hypothetical protein